MRAVSFLAADEVVVRDVADPVPGPGEALVAPRYVGLCGTDLELLNGTMPYFAMGTASYPLQPGHEVTGVVVQAPTGGLAPGTPVILDPVVGCGQCAACRDGRTGNCPDHRAIGVRLEMPGGAAELMTIPAQNLIALPPGLSLRDAVLAEPGTTALNCITAASPEPGMRALVVGAGTLGAIAAQLLRDRGLDVDMSIIEPGRRAFVESLGVRAVEEVSSDAYDVVVEYAGSAAAVRTAIDAVRPGGRVALAGVQPGTVDDFDVNAIVLKSIAVSGAGVTNTFPEMLEYLVSGGVAAEPLIERVYDLEDAPEAFALLADPSRQRPKLMLRIPG